MVRKGLEEKERQRTDLERKGKSRKGGGRETREGE